MEFVSIARLEEVPAGEARLFGSERFRALLVRVADEVYAIPLAHVSETIELESEILRTVKGREVLL